jgi:hypothetical protein
MGYVRERASVREIIREREREIIRAKEREIIRAKEREQQTTGKIERWGT